MKVEEHPLLIAVDGGGSHCRFALLHGGQRTELRLGPANVSTDMARAISTLTEGIEAVATSAGITAADLRSARAYLGLAGVVSADLSATVARALPFETVRVEDDRVAAVRGALGTSDGSVAGIGTGSFLARRNGGAVTLMGGWGFVLGDEASGADLGRNLLRRALHVVDGIETESGLTAQIRHEMGGPAGVVAFAAAAGATEFAALAPRIADAAMAGDLVARALMHEGAAYIQRGLSQLGWQAPEPLCLIGGLAPRYTDYLPEQLRASLHPPAGTALDGALALAAELPAIEGHDEDH